MIPVSEARTATADMVREANPPAGFEPILSNSNFGWENGPFFERKTSEGRERGFRVASRHINAGGICHGGMMMTFADILLASAVMDKVDPPFVTIRLTTDFIDAALEGEWVSGQAFAGEAADGVVPVQAVIKAGDRTVASASGVFKVIGRRPR